MLAGRDPAIGTAHATMQSLLGHRISPSPENYLVWFSYHAGTHAGLREEMDARHARQGAIHQLDLDEVYARFCAGEPQALAIGNVSRQLEAALSDAVGMLDSAHDDAARYGNRLEGLSDTLAAAAPTLTEALRRILADTQALCRNSRGLAQRLAERAREAEALRGALEEARHAAATDSLTGLSNRRAFEETLREAIETAEAQGVPLCLVSFDIDHFKTVNDRHGHAAGDSVLRGLAQTLREWARPGDCPARVGGEEFAVILPATGHEEATPLADALRRAVAREAFLAGANGEMLSVTISLGVAELRAGEGQDALLARADAALYDAKHQGRNRVVCELAPRAPRDWDSGPEVEAPKPSTGQAVGWR
jgi:diguanylate cyclase